ncbi:MAG TPA: sigma-54 dependent transcriptional regulator, partial [Thermoanaerobaculia bacterium]|nr:sigma-54 dependent transcriptional regulator [Thermoanaerobaculia bacterium]
VILLTGYGTVPIAVEAMRGGAYSFLEKPVEIDDLSRLVAEALGEPPAGPGGEAGAAGGPPGLHLPGGPSIIGRHPKLRAALNLLRRVAATEATVLLTGESGTGKELFARAIHGLSPRRAGPFAAVNCAAIPETLVENELFGHEKGAFTGADRRQAGRFEAAAGGTLFLDEIGELPLAVQGKVLRVIDERTFERIGGGSTLQADVRLVAATNRELGAMVATGGFRADLYYRLEVFPIELPPLRERPSDVPDLVRHLLAEIAVRLGRKPPRPEPEALELLAAQSWPGNVRELGNVLERALILSEGSRLGAADLEPLLAPLEGGGERERVRRALEQAGGDRRRAAAILGVSYRTLLRRIRRHDLGGYPEYR